MPSSSFSLVRFFWVIAKYGHYSHISVQIKGNFSALKTGWGGGKDLNPWYRSEWRKGRRFRKLRGINQFRILRQTGCSPFDTLNSAVSRLSRGEAPAIVWLKWSFQAPPHATLVRA